MDTHGASHSAWEYQAASQAVPRIDSHPQSTGRGKKVIPYWFQRQRRLHFCLLASRTVGQVLLNSPMQWTCYGHPRKCSPVTNSQMFHQPNRFIWEQQRIATLDIWSNGEPGVRPEKQRREKFFQGLGRDCCKQRIHWRKLKISRRVTSRWLSSCSLLLAELFLGKEAPFLLPGE